MDSRRKFRMNAESTTSTRTTATTKASGITTRIIGLVATLSASSPALANTPALTIEDSASVVLISLGLLSLWLKRKRLNQD